MFGFPIEAVIVAVLAAIAAGFVRGLAGFGLSVVPVPVLHSQAPQRRSQEPEPPVDIQGRQRADNREQELHCMPV